MAFYGRRTPPSFFVKERLPGEDGIVLHVEHYAPWGRLCVQVSTIRETADRFDLLMTGHADPPLEEFGDAHADLTGPTHSKTAAKRLARALNRHGTMEKVPDPTPTLP